VTRISLRHRLIIAGSAVVLLFFTVSVVIVDVYVRNLFQKQSIGNGQALAKTMAAHIADNLLAGDYASADVFFKDIMKTYSGASYIFVEKDGQAVLHTLKAGVPGKLLEVKHKRNVVGHVVVETDEGTFRDFSAPVSDGKAGYLHLGISGAEEAAMIRTTKRSLLLMALFALAATIATMAFIWQRLTAPLATLTLSASAIAEGGPVRNIEVTEDDEVGALALAFSRMADAVRVREEELRRVNTELEYVAMKLHSHIDELNRTRDELIRSKQDTAVLDTAHAFLHHVRQPLTYLVMAIEMLSEEMKKGETIKRADCADKVAAIEDAGERLADLLIRFEGVSGYKTVEYTDKTRILDIEK